MKIGIDLGTTYSLVARMGREGIPMLMPDSSEQDVFHTPSAVHVSGNCAMVGRMAEALEEQNPDAKVIRYFKRQFGEMTPLYYDDHGVAWYPPTIAALVLKKLRFDAENFVSEDIEGAVITVPAHFTDPQRKAVIAAAELADVALTCLVEEPVAAALHYGVTTSSNDRVILVYDFGGGTFDATVLTLNRQGIYVLAKAGLTELGGKELDDRISTMILDAFEKALGRAVPLNGSMLLALRRISEEIKIELSMPGKSYSRRMVLLGGTAVEVTVRRADFESAIAGYVARTEAETLRCLRDAGLSASDVNAVLLVGGSSMVPLVAQRIRDLFVPSGCEVLLHEPTKAVAFGAAMRAAQRAGEAKQYRLPAEFRGVTGYSVGIRTINPQSGRVTVDTLIKKNMPLPARVSKTYYTTRDDQQRMVLDLVQYRDPDSDCVSLGSLTVGPLASPRRNYPIEVSVENGDDGTVAVQAYDAETGFELKQVFGYEQSGGTGEIARQRELVRSVYINNI